MFAGIGILATFITALGSKLIELKLKEPKKGKKTEEISDEDLSTRTKELIRNQIEKVETLDQKDFDTLISMLISIRQNYGTKDPVW
jgi:hypothetical protein